MAVTRRPITSTIRQIGWTGGVFPPPPPVVCRPLKPLEPLNIQAYFQDGGDITIFDSEHRSQLQKDVLSGKIDPNDLLPDLLDYIECNYYNLFENKETKERHAVPISRRGNPQWALRQSFKKADLAKIIKKALISRTCNGHILSHLFFMTLTFDRKIMSCAQANQYITTAGKGLNKLFARLNKVLIGGYSKVSVKESTTSGYPAVHVLLYLNTPLKIKWHEKSHTYRPDTSDPYSKKVLGSLKNLNNWNSVSPVWGVGFIDIYGFTKERLSFHGYANPVNYIAKYISKSLDVENIPELKTCKKVSELPEKYRTAVWTILNNLIWNSQTWVISKSFRTALNRLKEVRDKLEGNWVHIKTVSINDPFLYLFMGYSKEDLPKNALPT